MYWNKDNYSNGVYCDLLRMYIHPKDSFNNTIFSVNFSTHFVSKCHPSSFQNICGCRRCNCFVPAQSHSMLGRSFGIILLCPFEITPCRWKKSDDGLAWLFSKHSSDYVAIENPFTTIKFSSYRYLWITSGSWEHKHLLPYEPFKTLLLQPKPQSWWGLLFKTPRNFKFLMEWKWRFCWVVFGD